MNQLLRLPASGKKSLLLISLLVCCFQMALAQPTMVKTGGTLSTSTGAFGTTTRKFQLVYQPSDLTGAASGNISHVYFEFASGGPITFSNFIIKMGQPASGLFPSSTSFHTGLTEVFNEASYSIDATGLSAGAWIEIPLENLFVYDVTLPLVIEVSNTAATGSSLSVRYTTGPSSPNHKKLYSSSSATATTGTTSTSWQNIGFKVTPIFPNDAGIVSVVAPVTPGTPGVTNVEVKLLNYGSSTLTSAQINWSVNGVTQTPFAWSGSLAQVASTNVTIGSFNFPAGNHTILAWTTLPNGAADGNTANDQASASVLFCTPVTGTVQVNSAFVVTDATLGQYKTFTDLANQLSSCGISGNVTVNVVAASGPYVEQVTFRTVPGAGPSARITINGNANVLEFSPNTVNRHILRFDAAQYFILDNLTVRLGTGAGYGYAIHLYRGSGNNTIQNCTIDMATNAGSSSAGSFYAGIVASGSTTSVLDEDDVHNLIIQNNTLQGGTTMGYGINIIGLASNKSSNNLIANNTINNYKSRGIAIYDTESTVVRRNTLSSSNVASGGMYIWNAHNNLTIDANTLTYSGNSNWEGLWLNTLTGTSIVKNNLIYKITNGDFSVYGIRLQAVSTGSKIYHNTIMIDDQTSAAGNAYAIYEGSSSNTGYDFKNNIYYVTRTGTGIKAAYALANLTNITTGLTSDYNVFWVPGGNAVVKGATTYANLAAWNGGGAGPQDIHSVEADPNFQPNSGIPTNLAINNIGATGLGVTEDIVGTTRLATPDPGAYEFPSSSAPLPVSFSYFTGVRSANGNRLTWGTASEADNAGFELQRSIDGRNYKALVFVPSAAINGNSSSPLDYAYTDVAPPATTSYYRLKQVDIDGNFTYSDIVVIKSPGVDAWELTLLYPNPVHHELGLIIRSPGAESLIIDVTDIAGRVIRAERFKLQNGDNRFTIDTKELSSGTYLLRISKGEGTPVVRKFVKH